MVVGVWLHVEMRTMSVVAGGEVMVALQLGKSRMLPEKGDEFPGIDIPATIWYFLNVLFI